MPKKTPVESGGVRAEAPVKGAGRVSFLAHKDHVRAEVEAGWPLKTIWQRLETSLDGMSYSQFCRYANRYLGDLLNDQHPLVPGQRSVSTAGNVTGRQHTPRAEGASTASRTPSERPADGPAIRSFQHKHDTDPNDLI
jgi:hypothetical protein